MFYIQNIFYFNTICVTSRQHFNCCPHFFLPATSNRLVIVIRSEKRDKRKKKKRTERKPQNTSKSRGFMY